MIFSSFRAVLVSSSILLLILASACNKKSITVGSDLLSKSTVPLSSSVYIPPLISQSNALKATVSNKVSYGLLGSLTQPLTGNATYSFASQLRLPTNGIDFGTDPILDSVKIYIPVGNTSDSTLYTQPSPTPIKIRIHSVEEVMRHPDSTYRSDHDFKIGSSIVEGGSYTWDHTLDSVRYLDDKTYKNKTPGLDITLNAAYFRKTILQLSKDDLRDNSRFIKQFKGLYFTCEANPTGLVTKFSLSGTQLTLYYRSNSKNETQTLSIDQYASRVNLTTYDHAIIESYRKNTRNLYLQGLSGLHPSMILLHEDELKKLRDSTLILSQAQLTLKRDAKDSHKYRPKRLTIYQNDKAISEASQNNFGGSGSEGTYTFNITTVVQNALKKSSTLKNLTISIRIPGASESIQSLTLDSTQTQLKINYSK